MIRERTHVFIIRLWIEPREIEGMSSEWRAMIEHIPTNQRRYVRSLDEIRTFIAAYLPATADQAEIDR